MAASTMSGQSTDEMTLDDTRPTFSCLEEYLGRSSDTVGRVPSGPGAKSGLCSALPPLGRRFLMGCPMRILAEGGGAKWQPTS